jgi:4-amino-4-deoxy-L-arabinose transferase-like glycosyltransferase
MMSSENLSHSDKKHFSYASKLIFWVIAIKVLIKTKLLFSAFLFSSHIGLFADEAQYWTWSKALSYGYYNTPAAIAYQVAFGGLFFGDTELGVRFGAFLLSSCLSFAIFHLSKKAGLPEKMAFLAALTFTLTPLGFASTFLTTPDCGAMLFWTLACSVFVDDLMQKKNCHSLLIGALIGIAALFDWTAFILWLPITMISCIYKKMTPSQLLKAIFISLLAIVPHLVWNWQHGIATIHDLAELFWTPSTQPLSFLAIQFGLLSPILMLLLLITLCAYIPLLKKLPPSLLFCFSVTVLCLCSGLLFSCYKKSQLHFAVFGYPTGCALILSYIQMRGPQLLKWLYAGLTLSCTLVIAMMTLLILERYYPDAAILPYRMNPFRGALGWKRLEQCMPDVGYNPKEQFLFSDRLQTTSLLSFYSPEKKGAYFFNIKHLKNNQFSYWPRMKECEKGKNGFYVGIVDGDCALDRAFALQQSTRLLLKNYFAEVTAIPTLVPLVEINEKVVKIAYFIRCNDYNGNEPTEGL